MSKLTPMPLLFGGSEVSAGQPARAHKEDKENRPTRLCPGPMGLGTLELESKLVDNQKSDGPLTPPHRRTRMGLLDRDLHAFV